MPPASEIRRTHRREYDQAPVKLTGCASCGDPAVTLTLERAAVPAHPHPDSTALQDEYRCPKCGNQTCIGLALPDEEG